MRSYISRMLSPGIVVPIDPNGTSAFLIFLRHIPELSRAVLTAVSSPIEQAECIVISDAVKHLPE